VPSTPLILVVGDDRLTEQVCAELTATTGHDVCVVWELSQDRQAVFRRLGVAVTPMPPGADAALIAARVSEATSILTLSPDDGLNLSVALRARVLNPRIRVVLRQFDTVLGRKLEQNLPDCTVLSLAAHAAATFAGAALEPTCTFAIRFPESDGPLMGFTQGTAAALAIGGLSVIDAEARLNARIVALGTREDPPGGAIVDAQEQVTLFERINERRRPARHARERTALPAGTVLASSLTMRAIVAALGRVNPILRLLTIAALAFIVLSLAFFHFALGKSWMAAAFYVTETMTNVGYGEVDLVTKRGPFVTASAIAAMLGGIVLTSIFIGYVSSAVTRAQWIALQGLRRISARGHVVICGAGKVGSAVMNVLTAAGKHVVVVEPNPSPDLIRRARERDVDLLTGDARGENTLDMCDLANATALLALSDVDAANLEVALGARARTPGIPLVVRMEDPDFAHATSQLLGIATFSPASLGAPAFAGLARFPGTRGRVRYGGDEHTVGQRVQGGTPERPPARECTALCVWRKGDVRFIRTFDEMQPFDTVLFSVPLGQFRPQDRNH
jgi:Trk K+ transport system NAD-binding subunit